MNISVVARCAHRTDGSPRRESTRRSPTPRARLASIKGNLIDLAIARIDPGAWYLPQTRDNNGSPDLREELIAE